mmetsp:Transcript_17078/g.19753  ORF Transcript_17078/g.19753 Transcript_17078/m.19753 type:complete len:434 (-) Transcript_17078:102-1403(-)
MMELFVTLVLLHLLSILTCQPLYSHAFTPQIQTSSTNRIQVQYKYPKRSLKKALFDQLQNNEANTISTLDQLDTNKLDLIRNAQVIDPSTEKQGTALDGIISATSDRNRNQNNNSNNYNDPKSILQNMFGTSTFSNSNPKFDYLLVIVMPQLGDFDSAEYAELLSAIQPELRNRKIGLRVIGIGDAKSAKRFAQFSGLDLSCIRVDTKGDLHCALKLHRGPNWDVPSFIPNGILEWFADYCRAAKPDDGTERDARSITRAWLNYMAMCAGISAPDTLPEIIRGYLGDKSAPERLGKDDIVTVPVSADGDDENEPFIVIKGITDVKLGSIQYQSLWKNEKGYQRPAELATVRLRVMVEVLSNLGEYVPDQRYLDLRGATYLFGGEQCDELLYEHVDTGVLSYSKTMKRPLSFLQPYIGEIALNPLGLGDTVKTN